MEYALLLLMPILFAAIDELIRGGRGQYGAALVDLSMGIVSNLPHFSDPKEQAAECLAGTDGAAADWFWWFAGAGSSFITGE